VDKKVGVIVLNPLLFNILDEEVAIRELVQTKHLPMVIPPKAWTDYNQGAYLTMDSIIMRTRGSSVQNKVLRDVDLSSVFDSLNVLNQTPWKINKSVLEVVLQVWDKGGGIGAIPSRVDNTIPLKPELVDEQKLWKKKTKKIQVENNNLHSLRCDMIHKLKVAQDFENETFYFPHNVDFRGRAYPIPPHLNHLGSDLNRGLLVFAEQRPIGERGIFWLKIHLANLCGQDKSSFDDRIRYIDTNIDEIMDSADNPLSGKRWWLESENPWQTLASCFELTNVLRSPSPKDYPSNVPIQMDGSCNGLQHYAALGRDNLGALHVNLLPTNKPMDVYTGVLNVVKKNIEMDSKNDHPIAAMLNGKVYRSTIKQTVMTSVYGVTWVGAREQIQKRLKEKKEVDEDMEYKCAAYLATVTLKSLGEVFSSAKAIMEWLNEIAHLVGSIDKPVMWVSPLGLPVVQPYRNKRKHQIQTVLQTVTMIDDDDKLPVHLARQKSAFPPNYVHSLDATHMLLTARKCEQAGITFASVHDSYWSHAQDVDQMNELIRMSFIELHSQPLLENLLEGCREMYPQIKFPDVPKRGTLDLNRVLKAKYFFD
jgi:DNA-directed RNA polymerase